jgi:hypothetical protein
MPKNKVSDPITDQEMAFARLVLSGGVTDRQAAEAVGLNPESAAYTKSKPSVRSYMLEHRAAVQQQLVQQDADLSRLPRLAVGPAVEGQHRLNPSREQVLDRLWEIANLSPEMTRNSITGQVKAISLIIAMENFIPDRRAVAAEKKSAPAPVNAQIYQSEWLRKQQAATHATTSDPQPTPAPPAPACRGACRGTQEEDSPSVPACPACPGVPRGVPWKPEPAPGPVAEVPPAPVPSQPTFAQRVPLADGVPPYVPQSTFAPDTRVPFSIKVNPFKHRR